MSDTTHEWRHDDKNFSWTYGYNDVDRNEFIVLLRVADEVMDSATGVDREILISAIRKYGADTLPPPLLEV